MSVVVLDPGHGGTDAGARGASGLLEKDVVLTFARATRATLERQGLRVVLTRQGDENPSFDDRAASANAEPGAIFLSLHVSSTGPVGTARVYYFPGTDAAQAIPANSPAGDRLRVALDAATLLRWERAYEPFQEASRRLAELLQVQLGQKLRGSPEVPAPGAVHQLRSVAAPAVALEISSVSATDPNSIAQMASTVAEAVARGVAAYRSLYEKGTR